MNMLSHSRFAASSRYSALHRSDGFEGPATARIEVSAPCYIHGIYVADCTADVLFRREETDRDGFHIIEMRLHDLRGGYPPRVVCDQDRDEASRDMAYEIDREFHSDGALRRAEDAMKQAEYVG